MKKMIAAILALTTVMGVFTGCGKKNTADTSENGGTKASVADTEDKDDTKKDDKYSDEDYTKLMDRFVDAAAGGDVDGLIKLCVPDSTYKPMKDLGMFDALLESVADDMAASRPEKVNIAEVRDPDEKELAMAEQLYSIFDMFFNKMSELGITYEMITGEEDVPEEVKADLTDAFSIYSGINDLENSDIEPTIKFDIYKLVTFEVEGDELELPVFKIKGENELKLDAVFYPSMLGYMKKSEKKSAEAEVGQLFRAVNSAACELDEQDMTIKHDAIISSDASRIITDAADSENIEELIKTSGYYVDLDTYGDYLCVMHQSICIFAAMEKDGRLTVYPEIGSLDLEDADKSALEECTDIDSLYDAVKKIFG